MQNPEDNVGSNADSSVLAKECGIASQSKFFEDFEEEITNPLNSLPKSFFQRFPAEARRLSFTRSPTSPMLIQIIAQERKSSSAPSTPERTPSVFPADRFRSISMGSPEGSPIGGFGQYSRLSMDIYDHYLRDPYQDAPPPEPDNPTTIDVEVSTTGETAGMETVKAGTLGKLVERLTPTLSAKFDNQYLFTFLLTYRTFTDASSLLDALRDRYNMPPPLGADFADFYKTTLRPIRLRVVQVLKTWVIEYYSDFKQSPEVQAKLYQMIELLRVTQMGPSADLLLNTFEHTVPKKRAATTGQRPQLSLSACPPPEQPKGWKKSNMMGMTVLPLQWPSREIARQLTLIEQRLFTSITSFDFLTNLYSKNPDTPVQDITKRFNLVSGWCASEILKCSDLELRRQLVIKFVEIGQALYDLNNLNGVREIVAGLKRGAVNRLKQTWEGVAGKHRLMYDDMTSLCSPDKNFANMRNKIKMVNPPCIPYLGTYLSDLVFINDGNKNTVDGKINFTKRTFLARVVQSMKMYQDTPYCLAPVMELQEALDKKISCIDNEDEMYKMSYALEPRGGNADSTAKQGARKLQKTEFVEILKIALQPAFAPRPVPVSLMLNLAPPHRVQYCTGEASVRESRFGGFLPVIVTAAADTSDPPPLARRASVSSMSSLSRTQSRPNVITQEMNETRRLLLICNDAVLVLGPRERSLFKCLGYSVASITLTDLDPPPVDGLERFPARVSDHEMVLTDAPASYCDICEQFMWGMTRSAMCCTTCNFKCHIDCAKQAKRAPVECSGGSRPHPRRRCAFELVGYSSSLSSASSEPFDALTIVCDDAEQKEMFYKYIRGAMFARLTSTAIPAADMLAEVGWDAMFGVLIQRKKEDAMHAVHVSKKLVEAVSAACFADTQKAEKAAEQATAAAGGLASALAATATATAADAVASTTSPQDSGIRDMVSQNVRTLLLAAKEYVGMRDVLKAECPEFNVADFMCNILEVLNFVFSEETMHVLFADYMSLFVDCLSMRSLDLSKICIRILRKAIKFESCFDKIAHPSSRIVDWLKALILTHKHSDLIRVQGQIIVDRLLQEPEDDDDWEELHSRISSHAFLVAPRYSEAFGMAAAPPPPTILEESVRAVGDTQEVSEEEEGEGETTEVQEEDRDHEGQERPAGFLYAHGEEPAETEEHSGEHHVVETPEKPAVAGGAVAEGEERPNDETEEGHNQRHVKFGDDSEAPRPQRSKSRTHTLSVYSFGAPYQTAGKPNSGSEELVQSPLLGSVRRLSVLTYSSHGRPSSPSSGPGSLQNIQGLMGSTMLAESKSRMSQSFMSPSLLGSNFDDI